MHHERAHIWLSDSAPFPWASCPLTENAVLRILGNPRYPNSPGPPAVVPPGVLGRDRLLDPSQITDAYLLALAVNHGGSLVTLDQRLQPDLVAGGAGALVVLDGV